RLEDATVEGSVVRLGSRIEVFLPGTHHVLEMHDPLRQELAVESRAGDFRAPMPGKIIAIFVAAGDGVEKDAPLLILEAMKIEHIHRLAEEGLPAVEAAAFVSPKWVPQMSDSARVMAGLRRKPGVAYPVLVPNLQGFEAACAAGVDEIAVFGAASETFSRKNINCSIAESLERFAPVVKAARVRKMRVRGYISCAAGCPYE